VVGGLARPTLGAMYLFWIVESIMAMNGRSHGHSHGEDFHNHHDIEVPNKVEPESTEPSTDESTDFSEKEIVSSNKTGPRWSVIGGIFVGDCFHNFVDGLAIGVAWTLSWGAGLGTTLAIVMHELPHELGDFIVYKKLGMSTRKALGLNLFAAMISFGGLYTGLALASDTDASQWLLALVAGLTSRWSMCYQKCEW